MNRPSTTDGKDDAEGELQDALRPIVSLISKSEKALTKLTPGTWQHTMLQDNLQALRMAFALMNGQGARAGPVSSEQVHAALHAFASMINKTEKAQAKLPQGTSSHTLQRNRLKALRLAEARVRQLSEQGV